jgi:lipoprotein-anchoring transpeptidase ErfK/SrfK
LFPRRSAVLAGLAVLLALAAALAGCGRSAPAQPAPAAAAPAPVATNPASSVDGPVSLGAAPAYVALARTDVTVRSKPGGGALVGLFPQQLGWKTTTSFLVHQARRVGGKLWYQVQLPRRPNETTGWVRADQTRLAPLSWRVDVSLARHQASLYHNDQLVRAFPVASGAPGTPTPTGSFYVLFKLHPPQISRVYGAFALGLAAWSNVLDQFGTGDGQIALHGTANTWELGHDVSHGCVRLDNQAITYLAGVLPIGTPVTVRA